MAFLKRTPPTAKAIRADAKRSGQIDDYVASQIVTDGPGSRLPSLPPGPSFMQPAMD